MFWCVFLPPGLILARRRYGPPDRVQRPPCSSKSAHGQLTTYTQACVRLVGVGRVFGYQLRVRPGSVFSYFSCFNTRTWMDLPGSIRARQVHRLVALARLCLHDGFCTVF